MGDTPVPNPVYDGPNTPTPKMIFRDYGFGTDAGSVTVNGVSLENITWSPTQVKGTLPVNATTGQLLITRANGKFAPMGITVHMDFPGAIYRLATGQTTRQLMDGAGITILGKDALTYSQIRVDGIGITGANTGGAFSSTDLWRT